MQIQSPFVRPRGETKEIVTPGQVITEDMQFMRGHGTYVLDNSLCSSVAGTIQKVNKLLSVNPLKSRYSGEIGDVVVGRIIEMQSKRWKVDLKARQEAILLLSSINLPGGVQRRKTEEDELEMSKYFNVGDLVCAEVQQFFHDGAASLHTRSSKYRKLKNGALIIVPSVLVKRSKSHFITLSCNVQVILGLNGYIWVAKNIPISPEIANQPEGMFSDVNDEISLEDRDCITRVCNVITCLSKQHFLISETSIAFAYDISLEYEPRHILLVENQIQIVQQTREQLEQATE